MSTSPGAGGPSYAELMGLSVLLAVAVVVPVVAAWRVADVFGAPMVGVVVGVLLGIVAACLILFSRLRRYW